MKIEEFANTGFLLAPWPTLVDGVKIRSFLQESDRCATKCPAIRSCSVENSDGEYTCAFGMSYLVRKINGQRFTVYGVRTDNNSTKISAQNRHWYSGRRLSSIEISSWFRRGGDFESAFQKTLSDAQTGLLDVLHDPVRLAKQINTIATNLARSGAAHNTQVSQLIENAPAEIKTLVKASEMLSDSFSLLTIYMNPIAATYGRQTATNLHGLTLKISAILRTNDEGGFQSGIDLRVSGSCLKNVAIYESFKLIPFALITNAIKYSPPGRPIFVSINDVSYGGVEIAVTSTGPIIEAQERSEIFKKNFRGKWAMNYEGRGVGLYLANIVALAHHTKIEVVSTALNQKLGDIPLATNRFVVRVTS